MPVFARCWHHSVSLLRLFLILGFLVVPSRFAWTQSTDASPSRSPIQDSPASEADRIHIDAEPRLESQTKPLTVNVDLVQVAVTVTDAMNHPVTGLTKEDFALIFLPKMAQSRWA